MIYGTHAGMSNQSPDIKLEHQISTGDQDALPRNGVIGNVFDHLKPIADIDTSLLSDCFKEESAVTTNSEDQCCTKNNNKIEGESPGAGPSNYMTDSIDYSYKRKRRAASIAQHLCPVCGLSLREKDLQQHYEWELSRLSSLGSAKSAHQRLRKKSCSTKSKKGKASHEECDDSESVIDLEEAAQQQQAYSDVRKRKINRQATELVESVTAASGTQDNDAVTSNTNKSEITIICPICCNVSSGQRQIVVNHLSDCIMEQQQSRLDNCDAYSDDDDDGEFYEEYTWAGQKRIRTTTLMQGNFQNIDGRTITLQMADDSSEELDVDGSGEVNYGGSQYNELDIIPCNADFPAEEEANQKIRAAMTCNEHPKPQERLKSKWNEETPGSLTDTNSKSILNETKMKTSLGVVDELKSKIGRLEERIAKECLRCLICMEAYQTPLVSVLCWHVYCEECWMRALGAKKLCPKCEVITTANDLRKIYL